MTSSWTADHACDRLWHLHSWPEQLTADRASNDSDRGNRVGGSPAYRGTLAAMPGKSRRRQTRNLCLEVGAPVRARLTITRWRAQRVPHQELPSSCVFPSVSSAP